MTTIDPSLYLKNQPQERKTGSDILGKDDFLKILMTQLQNQDPLNPMEDKDFIAQMAQFSSLEQMTNLGKSFERFAQIQEQNMLVTYNQFIGKEVTWHKLTDEDGDKPVVEEGTGRVVSIQFNGTSVSFILEDGTKLEPANISQVNDTFGESSIVQASMMIGKKVTWLNDAEQELSALVQSVATKNGKITFLMDDEAGSRITASQMIKVE